MFHPDEELALEIPLGRFVSFDYVAPEPRKAQAFYSTLFGFKIILVRSHAITRYEIGIFCKAP